jgi:hypothetical protein
MFLRLYTGASAWWTGLKAQLEEEHGATAVEYALMFVGTSAEDKFNEVGGAVAGA